MKLIAIVGIFSLLLAGCSQGPGEYDAFAQCLTGKDVTMYGTDWCSHCKNQKSLFGNSFQHVSYVDCDDNRNECLKAGVRAYPTWRIGNEMLEGTQELSTLAQKSGCEL